MTTYSIQAFDNAVDKVTADRLKAMTYGDCEHISDGFYLYHYEEEEHIVIFSDATADREDICVCQWNGDDIVITML